MGVRDLRMLLAARILLLDSTLALYLSSKRLKRFSTPSLSCSLRAWSLLWPFHAKYTSRPPGIMIASVNIIAWPKLVGIRLSVMRLISYCILYNLISILSIFLLADFLALSIIFNLFCCVG